MKIKKIFNKSIFKINNNDTLSVNFKHELNMTLKIINAVKKINITHM